MYRLLAIDLDGTLLSPEKLITPRTHDLLCQIEPKGMAIVMATWQTAQVLRAECGKLPLTAPQIIENGEVSSYEHAIAAAQALLREEAFAAAWSEGQSMALKEMILEGKYGV